MSEVDLVLKVSKVCLQALGDDDDSYHVQVAVEQGKATNEDLLNLGLSVAAAAIAEEQTLTGKELEDLLDDVWNRLADMVETTQRLGNNEVH
jgi:hypothetical protein